MKSDRHLHAAIEKLISNHHTIAVAESVTAGLIQNYLSRQPGAKEFFEGGVTAYNLQQKCTHLFIDPTHALECNCVSAKVAEEMALGVSRSFSTEWGVGITGYCSPVPELDVHELFCWMAVAYAGNVVLTKRIEAEANKDPVQVQKQFRDRVLDEVANVWSAFPTLAHKEN